MTEDTSDNIIDSIESTSQNILQKFFDDDVNSISFNLKSEEIGKLSECEKQELLKELIAKKPNDIAKKIALEIMVEWSGQAVYIKRFSERKENEILAEFDGTNYKALARKWSMAEYSIRRIIKRAIKRKRELQQGRLI